jgi:hypothetical protein
MPFAPTPEQCREPWVTTAAFQQTEGVQPSTWPDAAVPQMLHLAYLLPPGPVSRWRR